MQIGVITLGTSNQQRSIEFYTRLLACEAQCDSSGVAYFNLQGTRLALYPRADLARYVGLADPGSVNDEESFRPVTLSVNLASAALVDQSVERAKHAGARIVQAPGTASWGGHVAWIADADGHLWEFVYKPRQRPAINTP